MLGWAVWAAMLGVLVASFVYEATPLSGEILCVSRRFFGMPCPGCGLTRSFVAMAKLDVAAAFGHHLAGPWMWVTAAAAVVLKPGQVLRKWPSLWSTAPRLMQGWFMLLAVLYGIQMLRLLVGLVEMLT